MKLCAATVSLCEAKLPGLVRADLAIIASEKQQGTALVAQLGVKHLADDNIVIAGLVRSHLAALHHAQAAFDQRRSLQALAVGDSRKTVRHATRRELTRDGFLLLRQIIHCE